ncbi:hypothetical protein PRIC2_005888 [Phytophthora ramorum]
MVTTALAAVQLALKSRPDVAALGHVGTLISSYLDGSGMISLARACEFGSVRLLDRIWESSDPAADTHSSWSLFWYLRSDVHYNRYQFTESLRTAAERGDLEVIRWLLDHFSGCTAGVEVVEAAARCGHLEVLQHLLHYDNQEEKRNIIVWGEEDVKNAIEGGHGLVARWLYENIPDAERDLSRVMEFAVTMGDLTLVQWLLDDVYRPELHLPPPTMNDAAAGGHMDILQWIFEQGYNDGSDRALEGAAKNGRLDLVEWLVGKWITKGAREALQAACGEGHLGIVRSLLDRKLVQYPHFAMDCAIRGGHLEIVQYLSEVGIVCKPSEMVTNAASKGHLHVVTWLIEKFGKMAPLFPEIEPSRVSWFNNTAMDRAATNGHMHVLEFLDSLAVEMQAEGKNDAPTLSQYALSGAATMGHFEVVKWIRDKHPQLTFEAHTTTAPPSDGGASLASISESSDTHLDEEVVVDEGTIVDLEQLRVPTGDPSQGNSAQTGGEEDEEGDMNVADHIITNIFSLFWKPPETTGEVHTV